MKTRRAAKRPTKRRRNLLLSLILPTLLAAAGMTVLLKFGFWQLDRLEWKNDLIARVQSRMSMPSVPAPFESEWAKVNAKSDEYRRVRVVGTFKHEYEVAVFTTLSKPKGKLSGQGYWILTPLVQPNGSIVIVNRGFVPLAYRDSDTRKHGLIPGQVTITGPLRMPDPVHWFTPENVSSHNNWYRKDPAEIAKTLKLKRVAPFLVDSDGTTNPSRLPQGGETRVEFPNNHLGYAITWFGLAAALAGVFFAFVWQRIREA